MVDEAGEIEARVDGDVLLCDLEQVTQRAGTGQCTAAAQRIHQRDYERLLASSPIEVGEQLIVLVAALPDERHRLRGVDLLDAAVKIGSREAVGGVFVEADGDGLHDAGYLEERAKGDLDEMVDRHAQHASDSGDFGLATGLARRLLPRLRIGSGGVHRVHRLLVGVPVRLLDLAFTHAARASGNVDVVIAGDRDGGHRAVAARKMQQDQHICVVSAHGLVACVQRVVDVLGERLAMLVESAVQSHDQDVLLATAGPVAARQRLRGSDTARQVAISRPPHSREREHGDGGQGGQHPPADKRPTPLRRRVQAMAWRSSTR